MEELIDQLAESHPVLIVADNLPEAARATSVTAFMLHGELDEHGPTTGLFTDSDDEQTDRDVSGDFG